MSLPNRSLLHFYLDENEMLVDADIFSLHGMYLPQDGKLFYHGQLESFALTALQVHKHRNIVRVEFGKQDSYGGISISLIDNRNCIAGQTFFDSKAEMFGFIKGFNSGYKTRVT